MRFSLNGRTVMTSQYTSSVRRIVSALIYIPILFLITCQSRVNETANKNSENQLGRASSPYLLGHADNPVDWHEWSAEALDRAKKENKLLIISIGYASCHWCHVMEAESFMDTAVARIMNQNFVSIKIDREERPDIDQIYVNAAQLISGNAGWPLNAFALPDGRPFYAGTYFSKEQWIEILQRVIAANKNDRENILKQAESLTSGIQASEIILKAPDRSEKIDQKSYRDVFNSWSSFFDESSGGLKGEPKFPMPVIWEFLLQYQHLTGNQKALDIVARTLDKMALGGIYDQLGGGFSRYATDSQWKVPHFEKMLYDNAQLVSLYAHAYQVTKKPLYAQVIENTLEFTRREMTSSAGGFYSSINADSENEEGRFYVWTKKEVENILDAQTAELFADYYQMTDSGNWEDGKNILWIGTTDDEFASKHGMSVAEWNQMRANAERSLFLGRAKRIHPSVDDKILVSWNALMLKGYLDAYFALGRASYLQTALTSARFLEKNMVRQDGRLWRSYRDGRVSIDALLDDYALLAKAFIYLYQATFDVHWLDRARTITDYAVAHFRDVRSGLFYYVSDDAENLVARKMELADNVIPASNSVLAEVLYLLGEYYESDTYIRLSRTMLDQVAKQMTIDGPYYANWASLTGLIGYQPYEIAIVGEEAIAKSRKLLTHYIPTGIFMGGKSENLPLLKNKVVKGRTIIYVCRNKVCKLPEEDVAKAMQQLK